VKQKKKNKEEERREIGKGMNRCVVCFWFIAFHVTNLAFLFLFLFLLIEYTLVFV
jgi:hypothetical protein